MLFGTDGIRGPAGIHPIDPETAVRVGRAAARFARDAGSAEVFVARDTRPSGPMLSAAVRAGIAGEACRAVDLGVLPTAGLAVSLAACPDSVGVMITASHNPWMDNGFKILGPGGAKPTPAQTSAIEAWIADAGAGGVGILDDDGPAGLQRWLSALERLIDFDALQGRRIALDLAEGAATVARPWLEGLPIDWCFVDGDRINDGVGSEHPGRLAALVREQGCQAGIAVDGDADRCVLVDERGQVVHGDALTWLLARGLGVSSLAVTVMSTGALQPALPGVDITVTPVGDKHLQAAMRAAPIPLAAEESGHVLFSDHPGGDGLLAGLRALALVDGALSDALSTFEPWPRVKSKIRVGDRPPLDQVPALQQACIDGEAALGDGGRVFLRYSGTEPVLRILVEGRDADAVHQVAADVERVAREAL